MYCNRSKPDNKNYKMTKISQILILSIILFIAFFLRFYKLDQIPAGLHGDGASQAYNAFSILNTGLDRYGQPLPILFRNNGSYQPPVYTYLTVIPLLIFGNTVFAAYFISAFAGVILVLITYLFTYQLLNLPNKFIFALISSFIVAIAPWAVFFSRQVIEANLAVLLFSLSVYLFYLSLKRVNLFPLACLFLSISAHAYYSERLISIIFLPIFILLFRTIFFKNIQWVICGLIIFAIIQIPNLFIIESGAFTKRLDQVGYSSNNPLITFLNNFLVYFSPKNLFFDSDSSLGRTMPGLSVFYNWFLIPLLFGISYLIKNRQLASVKLIWLLLLITPIPAAFTGDFFYPLRTLTLLWVLTLVIAIGIYNITNLIKPLAIKMLLAVVLISYSFFSLYVSYFILFKYERAIDYGYVYIKLMDELTKYSNKQIVIDSGRDPGIGIRLAYLRKYNPKKMQSQLHPQLKTPYYNSVVNTDEIINIDNIEVKPLDWGDSCKEDLIIIGDELAISQDNSLEHKLRLEFEIYDLSGKPGLKGYSTNPEQKCS